MVWQPDAPQGKESDKIKHLIVPYVRGQGLDVGCGLSKAWPGMIGLDNGEDYNKNVADITADGRALPMFADNSLDYVFSSHFLEHCEETVPTLREWWRVIKPGGHLVLYLPHADLYPNIGEEGSNADHQHDFINEDIVGAMKHAGKSGWVLLEDEVRGDRDEYSVYRKTNDRLHITDTWQRPEKSVVVIRYGGFGDMIQTASVLPGLKKQGYHITVNTTPRGYEVFEHDPHVDAFLLQDSNQVPNEDLGPYWWRLHERFDKVLNFSQSVEWELLPTQNVIKFHYPDEARRKICNVNYFERMHDIASVPYEEMAPFFYPSAKDAEWAIKQRKAIGSAPFILWSLSGSSIHKTWPHTHVVAQYLMERTDCKIMFVGGVDERELEIGICEILSEMSTDDIREAMIKHGLDNPDAVRRSDFINWLGGDGHRYIKHVADRVNKKYGPRRIMPASGHWPISRILALAAHADIVVGPETGVLNAVGHLPMPKVVMLSHSSEENLTKHWINTTALIGDVPCYPCHRMHYGPQFCFVENGSAICATEIKPDTMFEAIVEGLEPWLAREAAE
jgi:ADP-heptose:LPS heptosyltransferase/predicted SAM-dependent methyltransferase